MFYCLLYAFSDKLTASISIIDDVSKHMINRLKTHAHRKSDHSMGGGQ